MAIIRRSQWGAPATSPASYIGSTRGVKVHYLGTAYSSRPHAECAAYVRQIRASHLANKTENYVDIAYNFLVCEHGDVFEGRGAHKRTGANGTAALNTQDYAVCALLGSSGLTKPTEAMLHGLRDAIEELRANGRAGSWVGGHKDGHPTSCPGDALYDWVQRGAPRPATAAEPKPTPGPKPSVDLSKLVAAAKADPPKRGTPVSYYGTKTVESALVAEGLLARDVADGHYGTATVRAYAAWQRKCGYKGADADGIPGPESLKKLATKRGFTITP
ncbi:N-acetylmuramoyl-L-alanine amidase [Streptomyces sp. P9(2023)]|uniref:N-acetylmuramoyl-L-alanine amidase n=1 Tax=Streptomyces sp. P9(2023) TaxID=3064394 RepID=UPI0028F42A95|nr:N-acetylmuramoyl-L-alanine amidase [Streptomyces sp. P9(2023)]MDT9688202.1 N-acetylmuramoyl-L-alanine amidase [Streptomyces sp. P9(2023)]